MRTFGAHAARGLLAGAFLLLAAPAIAQDWPTRPVRLIVPFTPGALPISSGV